MDLWQPDADRSDARPEALGTNAAAFGLALQQLPTLSSADEKARLEGRSAG